MNRRLVAAASLTALVAICTACSADAAENASATSTTTVRPTASTPRATTAIVTPEDRLARAVRRFDEAGIVHQGPQWLADRATEVCADWDEMGGPAGFTYAVLGQELNFRPDTDKAADAVVILTQTHCPQWATYIN